jgi:glyoxylase-like metal-dependent hydrolase (beta-lactamase superfamily II)
LDTATAGVSVHAIRTGNVRIRANQIKGTGHGQKRLLRTYTGVAWSDWLPIYAWLIEHPEGSIVVDTGETARVAEPGYFPSWHPFFRRGLEERVTTGEEIGPQLEDRWVDSRHVRRVVMTHLHTDHAGGLHHFPNSEILIEPQEYAAASGLRGRLRGYLPNRLPAWLRPTFIRFLPVPFGPFERSLPLTAAGDVVIVPTPGHTAGHVSVVVRAEAATYFLAGDTSYTEALMLEGQVDGVSPDEAAARDTLRRIRLLAEQESLVYLPSHDPESAERLRTNRLALDVRAPESAAGTTLTVHQERSSDNTSVKSTSGRGGAR